jgi:hypothetical protein
MAAIAQSFPAATRPFPWLWEWLREELAPYPGRALLVARMVTAATLVIIVSMTFRLPYGAYAALYALNISRDSLEGTRRAVQSIVVGFLFAGAYILGGTLVVLGDPVLRFLWIVGTLFLIQTSLAVARDRVVGVLIGLLVMWLVFDQLWSAPGGVAMKKAFTSGLLLLAQLVREPVSGDLRTAIERSYSLRESINAQFDKVLSLADGVLFEFGPERQRDLELRSLIRRWVPELRTLFVMRNASWKYRAQLPGFEFPGKVRVRQAAYDERSAQILEEMAVRIEDRRSGTERAFENSAELMQLAIEETQAEESHGLAAGRAQSFITLLREIDGLTGSLASEITAEFGGV